MRALLLVLLLAGCVAPPAAPAPEPASASALACDPCRVEVASLGVGTREPVIAVDPREPARLAIATMRLHTVGEAVGRHAIALSTSEDGGATWTTRDHAHDAALASYDPTLVALDDGTFVLGGVMLDGAYSPFGPAQGRARIFAAPALGAPVVIDEGGGAEVPAAMGAAVALRAPDKPALAAGPGGLVLAAYSVRTRETPLAPMDVAVEAAVSRDGARTWTRLGALSDGLAGQPLVAPGVWVVPVAALEGRDVVSCALLVSTDEGASWARRELGACAWLPSVAAEGARLHVALPAAPTLVLWSDDLGATWSAPVVVGEGAGEDAPTLVALEDGALLVTHFVALPSGDTSLRATLVRDGAVAARLVLEEPLWRAPFQMGEYFGLAAVPGGAVASWVGEAEDGAPVVAFARLRLGGEV